MKFVTPEDEAVEAAIQKIVARGYTDIGKGLDEALCVLERNKWSDTSETRSAPGLLMLLSDGQANQGITDAGVLLAHLEVETKSHKFTFLGYNRIKKIRSRLHSFLRIYREPRHRDAFRCYASW